MRNQNRRISKQLGIGRKDSGRGSVVGRLFDNDRMYASNPTIRSNQVAPLNDNALEQEMLRKMSQPDEDHDLRSAQGGGFKGSLIRVVKNRQFVLLFFSYGKSVSLVYD